MHLKPALLTVIGAALLAVLFWQRGNVMGLIKLASRGKRLTNAPPDASGRIPLSPDALVAQAERNLGRSIDPDVFALAKMLASEGGRDGPRAREARAWVAFNDLRAMEKRHGWRSFTKLFTYSNRQEQNGFFGLQNKGRRYGSKAEVYEGHIYDAEALMEAFTTSPDPTGGATKFADSKSLGGVQPGTEGKTIASLEKDWGLKARLVPGSGDLYIFGGRAA